MFLNEEIEEPVYDAFSHTWNAFKANEKFQFIVRGARHSKLFGILESKYMTSATSSLRM